MICAKDKEKVGVFNTANAVSISKPALKSMLIFQ